MKVSTITQQAVNQWDTIFSSLGIKVNCQGLHTSCPHCGGKDRFRYDNKEGRGTYICNQCGAGDGLDLICKVYQCSPADAADKVSEVLSLEKENLSSGKQANKENAQSISEKVDYLLQKSILGQSEYLNKKGLTLPLNMLDGERIFAPATDINGKFTGGQFISPSGDKQLMRGTIKNGSFMTVNQNDKPIKEQIDQAKQIIICEGLATGVTLSLIEPCLILAAIDAGNLPHVAKAVREKNKTAKIIIAGDNDSHLEQNKGKQKAIEAAKQVNGYYSVPDTDHQCDWDDYRQQYGIDSLKASFNRLIQQDTINKPKKQPYLSQMQASQRADVLREYYDNDLALDILSNNIFEYLNGVWKNIPDIDLMRVMVSIFDNANTHYSEKGIKSTIDTLKLQLPLLGEQERHLIGFKNGVFDLKNGVFKPHKKENWLQVASEIDFTPSTKNESLSVCAPHFYKWLKHASGGDAKKIDSLLAALFMVLANRYDWQLFIEITGAGGSGKSIFAEIATMLAGSNNTVSASMNALEQPRERALIVGKSLIILPDQAKYVGEGNGIKAITGGDAVAIDPKHKAPYSSKIPAVILAVNNNPMSFGNDDGGISRRRVIFHFGESVPEHESDPDLRDKIEVELAIIIRYLLKYFSDPNKAKRLLYEQLRSNEALEVKRTTNTLVDFCGYLLTSLNTDGMLMGSANIIPFNFRKYLYHAYLEFIRANGLSKPLSLMQFGLSLSACLAEHGRPYLKKRTMYGVRTNLSLNEETGIDWFPKATGNSSTSE